MKKLFLALGAVSMLGACNTVAGIGEDISAGGRVITDASDDVEEQIDREPEEDKSDEELKGG
ncbi:MAG: entericidin A/B family lipoprotein [Pseudomonadota bacterium]